MWNQLPERFGKWNSVYRCHLRWAHRGLWTQILMALEGNSTTHELLSMDATFVKAHQDACRHGGDPEKQGLGKTKGGRNSKINALVNGEGRAVRMILLPGNQHEVLSASELLGAELSGSVVLADKGYQSAALAEHILRAGGTPNIPSRKGTLDPLPYHSDLGKLRHVVENFFCRLKRSRRVDTRYDRLAATFMAFVTLAVLDDWLRN
jgi:transposase